MHTARIPFTIILVPHYHPAHALIAPYRPCVISGAGDTHVREVKDGVIAQHTLHPSHFGLRVHQLPLVSGGTAAENSDMFKALLTSGAHITNSLEPVLDSVLLIASALLAVAVLVVILRKA
ncbi:hypothetical protein DFH11DRAFT_1881103 [Phellopilus nigrolimitatus]|nr:hypothetical protein DFH11DRAFT_1881103 [Phellopilus nigrolimitatus]